MASSRPGQAASVLFYFSLVLVAASSVAFGFDWMKAPLPPMPETEASVQAAKLAAHVPPPRVVVAKKAPRSVYPGRTEPQAPQAGRAVAAVDATGRQQAAAATPDIMAPEPTAQQTPAADAQPKCDVAACSAAYHSFRVSDCTWQPFDGPRRFCDKGNPPQQQQAVVDPSQFSDKCDIEACRQAYFTFDPTDCTYQPSNGPRRLCSKGTPPKPATAEAPAAATPAAVAATPAPVSDKCDVEACKRAYLTFNPADCTYKATLYGPRQLCTKGTPPKPVAATEPAAAPPPAAAVPPPPDAAAPESEQAKQEVPAAAAPVSGKCDVDACKRAYFTFNPADCTYQPSDGPRRLCSKGTPPKPVAATEPAAAPQAHNVAPAAAAPPKNEPTKQEVAAPAKEQAKQETTAPPAASAPAAAAPPVTVAAPTAAEPTKNEPTKQEATAPAKEQAKQETTAPPAASAPAAAAPPVAVAAPAAAEPTKNEPAKQEAAAPAGEQAKQEPAAPADATPPVAAAPSAPVAQPAPATPPATAAAPAVSDKCDIAACKQAYFTFNPADCTYKPSLNGPRQLCTKGTPPKPQAKAEPAAVPAPADTTPAADATPPADQQTKQETAAPAATTPAVTDKCDVAACKQAYFTFNPADCTFQPSSGPRRLCTKGTPAKPQAAAPSAARAPRTGPRHILPPGLVPAGR